MSRSTIRNTGALRDLWLGLRVGVGGGGEGGGMGLGGTRRDPRRGRGGVEGRGTLPC